MGKMNSFSQFMGIQQGLLSKFPEHPHSCDVTIWAPVFRKRALVQHTLQYWRHKAPQPGEWF